MRRVLLIVGGADPAEGNRKLPVYYDRMWTFLSVAKKDSMIRSRADMIWDCHGPINSFADRAKYRGKRLPLFDLRCPERSGLLEAERFDAPSLIRTYGQHFASQACWMAAYANDLGYHQVIMWRFYQDPMQTEYMDQVPELCWIMGQADSTEYSFDPACVIMRPKTYGLKA